MKSMTTSQFRQDIANAYNQAQTKGGVIIVHRDRPDMLLITQEEFERQLNSKFEEGKSTQAA